MRLGVEADGREFHHSVSDSFGHLLREALRGHPVAAAHGPVYAEDPAADLLAPFVRSARESGWSFDEIYVPEWVLLRALESRADAVRAALPGLDLAEVDRWTRAGLVLEIAGRWGVPRSTGLRTHVRWRLRGTVTGRFGVEPGSRFNPMVLDEDGRRSVRASEDFELATVDFNAMDLRSMIAVVPGLRERYGEAEDLHARTAEILFGSSDAALRDRAKGEVFVHAYGGRSELPFIGRMLPELDALRSMPHGEGARTVQATSAIAFRAGLAEALPLLVDDQVRPLFTVHDELTLEFRRGHQEDVQAVMAALERGASQTIGVPYRVKCRTGRTYQETKA